jgi:hypothetical protein
MMMNLSSRRPFKFTRFLMIADLVDMEEAFLTAAFGFFKDAFLPAWRRGGSAINHGMTIMKGIREYGTNGKDGTD